MSLARRRGILIRPQPRQAIADVEIFFGGAGDLENVQDQAGGVAVGRCGRGLDLAFGIFTKRAQSPAAVRLSFRPSCFSIDSKMV